MILIRKFREKLEKDEHFAELVRGSGTAFVLRIVGIVFGYLFMLLVTRTLGAKAWGIFALCLVVLQVSSVIGRLGMDMVLLRFTAEYVAKGRIDVLRDIYRKTLMLVGPFSVLISILLYVLSPVLADRVFHKPYLYGSFRIVSLVIAPFVLLFIYLESIRGLKKIKEYMLLQQTGLYGLTLIIFTIGIVLVGKEVMLPVFSYMIAVVILSIVAFSLWIKYSSSVFQSQNDKERSQSEAKEFLFTYRNLLSISIPMLLSSSLALIMGWTDTIMLSMFKSAKDVGIYNVAMRVAAITSITLIAINTIAAPKFAEFWGKKDLKGLAMIAQQSTELIFWTSLPILAAFLFFPEPILSIFGQEFEKGTVALMILTFGQFISISTGSVGYILNMSSNERILFSIWLISVLIVVIGNMLLIPMFGINGAALSNLISQLWASIAALIAVRIKLKFWNLPFIMGKV